MKKTKTLFTMLIIITALSFKTTENFSLKTGIYGVCNCDDNTAMAIKTELLINDDFTFHYFNNSNPSKKIDVKGKWTRKGNSIYLHDYQSEFAMHNKWIIDKNEKCLKSRKGMNFTRLCHIKSCNEK